jgi:hypothetical protein
VDGAPCIKFTSVTYDTGYPRITDDFLNSTVTGPYSVSFEVKGTDGAQLNLNIYESGSTKVGHTATLTLD